MGKRFQQAITPQLDFLAKHIRTDLEMLFKLQAEGIISAVQRLKIRSKDTDFEKAVELLDALEECSDDKFDIFCTILTENGQDGIARRLWTQTASKTLQSDYIPTGSSGNKQTHTAASPVLPSIGLQSARQIQNEPGRLAQPKSSMPVSNTAIAARNFLPSIEPQSAMQIQREPGRLAQQKSSLPYVPDTAVAAGNFLPSIVPQSAKQIQKEPGRLVQERSPQPVANTRSVIVPASEDHSGDVIGLAIHDQKLFILRRVHNGRIEVYNAVDYSFQRYLEVKEIGLSPVHGMASCETNNCLYVSSYNLFATSEIIRVDLTGKETIKWKVGAPEGLSVTSQHNLLVSSSKGFTNHKLIEYTTVGEFVREIILEDDISFPEHAIQFQSSPPMFLVCSTFSGNRVSLVNADGRILLHYGDKYSRPARRLDEPRNLAVSRDGFIFVADKNNNRIVVLNSRLRWSGELHIGERLANPYSLCFDKRRSQLFIGEEHGDKSRIVVVKF